MTRFTNKVVLVTGAARGIGRGIAVKLASEGADVIVNDFYNMDMAHETADTIRSMGRNVLVVQADVSNRESVANLMEEAVDHFGRLDVVASNAAVSVRQPVVEAEWEGVQRTIEVTQFGVFNICQMAAQQMVTQELIGRSRGKIVITSSVLAELPFRSSAAYNMAKAAVNHFGRTLAAELCDKRINVNMIQPGWIDTPGERAFTSEEDIQAAAPKLPWGRLGQPEDIACAVAFLASDEADYITGSTLRVDGGYMVNMVVADPETVQ